MTLGQEKKSFVRGEKKKAQTIKGKTKKQTIAYHYIHYIYQKHYIQIKNNITRKVMQHKEETTGYYVEFVFLSLYLLLSPIMCVSFHLK